MIINGNYQIIYNNNIIQNKKLIDQVEYDLYRFSERKILKQGLSSKIEMESLNELKKAFKLKHGDEWFTTKSPLGLAIESGLLVLPEHQGDTSVCEIFLNIN